MLLTFNPPGSPEDETGGSGRWVIDYFAPWLNERHPEYPVPPGELRYFVKNEEGLEIQVPDGTPYEFELGGQRILNKPESRTFIPARVSDNAYLAQDQNYVTRLASMDEPFRSQMLLGDFRSGIVDAEYQVIPSKWYDAAVERWKEKCSGPHDFGHMHALGIDVARGGRADTVYAPRHGWDFGTLVRQKGKDTPDGATVGGKALELVNHHHGAEICIDSNGVGASPYDWLKDKWPTTGVPFQGSPADIQQYERGHKFHNMRAALWWMMRLMLDPDRGFDVCLPPDSRLRSEMIAPRFSIRGGKLIIEDKDDIKKRLRFTLDAADAVVLGLRNMSKTPGVERLKPKTDFRVATQHIPASARSTGWMAR